MLPHGLPDFTFQVDRKSFLVNIITKKGFFMRKTKQQKETEDALLKRALGFTQEEIYSEDIIDKESGEVTNLAKRKIMFSIICVFTEISQEN